MIFTEDGTDVSCAGSNQESTLYTRGSPNASCLLELHDRVCVHISLPDWDLHFQKCLSNIMFSAHHAERNSNTRLRLDSAHT